LSKERSREISSVVPSGENYWSDYPQKSLGMPRRVE